MAKTLRMEKHITLRKTLGAWGIIAQSLKRGENNVLIARIPVINIGIWNNKGRPRIHEYYGHIISQSRDLNASRKYYHLNHIRYMYTHYA